MWLIPLADEMQGVQIKLCYPLTMCAIPEHLGDVSYIGAIHRRPFALTFTQLAYLSVAQVILLSSLKEPVPRPIYDQVVRSSVIDQLLDCLNGRHLARKSIGRHDSTPVYPEVADSLAPLIRKLTSQGMTVDIEEKLVVSSNLHFISKNDTVFIFKFFCNL